MGRLGAMDVRLGGARRRCRQKAEKDESAAHDAPLACRSAAMLCLPPRKVKHPLREGGQPQRPVASSSWAFASTQPPMVPSLRCSRFQNGARVFR